MTKGTILRPIVGRYEEFRDISREEQKVLFKEVTSLVRANYKEAPPFQTYFQINKETGEINGSSIYWAIPLNDALAKSGKRTLTAPEFIEFDRTAKGFLTKGVYTDHGLGVISAEGPNTNLSLTQEAVKLGLPVLAHPLALRLSSDGTDILFKKNYDPSLVLLGEQAKAELEKFDYVAKSGVHRLCRDFGGLSYAGWDSLPSSGDDGRVGKIRGEATAQDLEADAVARVKQETQLHADKFLTDLRKREQSAIDSILQKK